jgi:alpha-beta hydrolase superfamily lysophospholipase
MFWFVVVAFAATAVAFRNPIRTSIEHYFLFMGAGKKTPLPSDMEEIATGVYRVKARTTLVRGVVVFLHGNGTDAPGFYPFLSLMAQRGWQVIAPEYPGYGVLSEQEVGVTATREHLVRIWSRVMATVPDTMPRVLVGFSLGGGLAYSIADRLDKRTPPTKLVLLNTFSGLGSFSGSSFMSQELAQWSIRQLQTWRGPVRIIYSPKDELFSPEHVRDMELHCKKRGLPVIAYALRDLQAVQQYHSNSPLVDTQWLDLLEV